MYLKSRKSFEVRRGKIIISPCAKIKHTVKHDFGVCQKKAQGKACTVKYVFIVCYIFAICPIESTRQTTRHTAKSGILIVTHTNSYF